MQRKAMQEIAEKLIPSGAAEDAANDKPCYPLMGKKWIRHPISHSSIHQFGIISQGAVVKPQAMAFFVDGGNAGIFSSPRQCLHALRAAAVSFSGKEKSIVGRAELFALSTSIADEEEAKGKLRLELLQYSGKSLFKADTLIFEGAFFLNGTRSISPQKGIDAVRRLAELHLAIHIANECKEGSILVLDGSLESHFAEEEALLSELKKACQKKGVIACGLSKSSGILTSNGILVQEELAKFHFPGGNAGKFYCHIASEASGLERKIFFVKLHEKSVHFFRLDTFQIDSPKLLLLLALLSQQATDLAFPGYPYGLISADSLARISNNEMEFLQSAFYSRIKAGSISSLKAQLSSNNAHSILDRI